MNGVARSITCCSMLGGQEYHLGVHQESDLGGCRRDCVGVMCDEECRGGGAEGEEEAL